MTISPVAAQSDRSLTLAVIELTSGSRWVYEGDLNSRYDFNNINEPYKDSDKETDDSADLPEGEIVEQN